MTFAYLLLIQAITTATLKYLATYRNILGNQEFI